MKSVLWVLLGGMITYYAMIEWVEYKLVDQAAEAAYAQGKADLLKLSPLPSPELEMACVALWIGEQHKKGAASARK